MRVMTLSYGQDRAGTRPPKIGHPSLAEAGTGRLTPRGRRAAEAFLARFPGGLRCLALGSGATWRQAKKYERLFGADELETLCLFALMKAVRRWRPRDGALTTATVSAIRSELRECFRPAKLPVVVARSPMPRPRVRGIDVPESPLLLAPARPEAPAERPAADLDELVALARRHEDLTDREERLARLYYGDDLKLRELQAVAGVTRERVRQVCKKALEKLRAAAELRPEPNPRRV